MSRYLILELEIQNTHSTGGDNDSSWRERGIVESASLEGAVRAYMESAKSEIGGGVYMAVPERSSKRVYVEVQNVRKVSVKAGDEDAG